MLSAQQRFWPDPQPLVERLGKDFFRAVPESPGIYMMHGRASKILYVGKAKNLRHRLGSYRRANPDRMPKRIVRLLHLVETIAYEKCADESAALTREAELILTLKPRFNRAGVWRGPKKFLLWRCQREGLELAVSELQHDGWHEAGAFGGAAIYLHRALIRLLWTRLHPHKGLIGMPAGWFADKHSPQVLIRHDEKALVAEASFYLSELAAGKIEAFSQWLTLPENSFEQQSHAEDLEFVTGHFQD
jgi:predicted GIY-YIG superfamily endonuclease